MAAGFRRPELIVSGPGGRRTAVRYRKENPGCGGFPAGGLRDFPAGDCVP
jgi:hypothetical protein